MTIENTASYIEGWRRAIRADAKLIVTSAAAAHCGAESGCMIQGGPVAFFLKQ